MQSFNTDAALYYPWVRLFKKELSIPHFWVADISCINPDKLYEYGFKGVLFDKDNTLTVPYANEIHPNIQKVFSRFKALFGDCLAVLSNSAGTQDDRGYQDAETIEKLLGISVIRHRRKKPSCVDEVIAYFACSPTDLVICGDRVFTDIVFGNRYGMLTILTDIFTEDGDNPSGARARRYERPLLEKWLSSGIMPPAHKRYHSDICLITKKRGL